MAFCCGHASLLAQSPSPTPSLVTLQYPASQLTDVLALYAQLSGRKLWLQFGLSMDAKVTIFHSKPMPFSEALSLIRGTLLHDCAIEIREVGDAEAYVSRVNDPRVEELHLHLLPLPTPDGQPRMRGVLKRQS